MNKKLVSMVAFLVTWKIVGTVMVPCQDAKQQDPISGFCFQPINEVRSALFDTKDKGEDAVHRIKGTHNPAYNVDDVRMYEESKLTKEKPQKYPGLPPVDKTKPL